MTHLGSESISIGFNRRIGREFHGAKVTSDDGLPAYRDLDDALGLFESIVTVLNGRPTGRNIRHELPTLYTASDSTIAWRILKMQMMCSVYPSTR